MLVDLKYLEQMTGNDSQIIKEMIELFLNQLAEVREEMTLLVDGSNWFELSRQAHKIKSSALVIGVAKMAEEMKELEMLAKESKNTEKYPEYVARFHTMVDVIEKELRPLLDA